MAILSFEQFVKQAGGKPTDVKTVTPQILAQKSGFLSRVSKDIASRGENIASEITNVQQNPLLSGIKATGQAFSAISDVAGEAIKTVAPELSKKVTEVTQKGFNIPVEVLSNTKLFQEASKYPEQIKVLEDFLQAGGSLGEISGNILLAKGAATTAQGAVDLTKAGAKKAMAPTGRTIAKGGKKLYSSAFDLTADEARLVQGNKINVAFLTKERAKFPKGSKEYKTLTDQIETNKLPITRATTALEKGIAGTEKQVGVKAGVEKMDIWKNKLEPALKASKDTMTKDELLAGARERVASEIEPTRKLAMQNALDSIEADYANFKPTDLFTMNKIKTGLDTFTPSKIFKGQEVASELKTLKADMANAIRQKTYTSLKDIGAKRAYIDYGNLKQLEKVGIKALTEAGTKGGFGGFWSTVYDMATVPVKTIGGKVLYRVGNKLEFVGEKGTKTLRQHLESRGIKIKQP